MIDRDALNLAIEGALRRPFCWGRDDCCTFACDAIVAAGGPDLMAPLRGAYDSEAGAHAALRGLGGGLVEAALALAATAGLIAVAHPYHDADIAVVAAENGPMLALQGGNAWVVRTVDGVARLPLWRAVLAWRLP